MELNKQTRKWRVLPEAGGVSLWQKWEDGATHKLASCMALLVASLAGAQLQIWDPYETSLKHNPHSGLAGGETLEELLCYMGNVIARSRGIDGGGYVLLLLLK